MTPESSVVSATPDSGASTAVDSPSTSQGSVSSQAEPSQGSVTPTVQSGSQPADTAPDDPLAGLPTVEELKALSEQKIPHAEGLARVRSAYEALKPQFSELQERFKPFESIADRFQSPDELTSILKFNDTLFGYERDDRNQLVPSTQTFASDLAAKDPLVADFLAADLMNGTTRTDDGREVPRIDLALEEMARDPQRRATALKILGGVEPSSIAPTWQPTAEQLAVVRPELQDIFSKLPYEKREALSANDPSFINEYLEEQKFRADLIEQNRQSQQLQTQQQQQREQYIARQAASAGNTQVETGFRAGMSEFAKSVVEKARFVSPLDPKSPEAQNMAPEQVQQYNSRAEQINTGVGTLVAVVTAALAVPDTQWMATEFLKGLGIDDKLIANFDQARQQYASNQRDYGELAFHSQNGGQAPAGIGTLQANANSAMKSMKGYGNLIAQPLLKLFSDFFETRAGDYNSNLNGSGSVRPALNGNGYDPTKAAPANLPSGPLTRAEINARFG